jgi:t-SNARE complex subunit (syntaxin)
MPTDEEKKQKRAELLKKLHSKVDSKQATRMNKQFKNKKVDEIKEHMSQGDPEMKENIEKIRKKLKLKILSLKYCIRLVIQIVLIVF